MSFEILIETTAIEDRVTGLIEKLKVVPVPAELTEWQKLDMKRRYPETEEVNPTTGMTTIYPRSRRDATWLKRKRAVARASMRTKPLLRGKATRIVAPSNRPILRPELFEKLRERMLAMLLREASW